MGFWKGFGRLIAGKPVFQAGDEVPHDNIPEATPIDEVQPQPVDNLRDASGRKIVPQINISDVRTHQNGSNMTVTAWAMNNSDYAVRIDDCTMLSQHTKLYRELSPHQSHEIMFYRGPVAASDRDYRARLTFKISENTDMFEQNYVTRFHRNSDGTFIVDEIRTEGGVHDI